MRSQPQARLHGMLPTHNTKVTTPRARAVHPMSLVRALRARPRLLGSSLVGLVVYAAGQAMIHTSAAAMALVGWNAGAILYLLLSWQMMAGTHPQVIRERAISQDEGRVAILLLVVLAAAAVLL